MDPLFDMIDIDQEIERSAENLKASAVKQERPSGLVQIRCRASELLNELFEEIKSGNFIEYCTAGEFSTHQLLRYLLKQSGPADVYISTWTMKEDPARLLHSLKQSGAIRNLYFVFDYRIRTLDAKHFDFISKIATGYVLTKCHAKVMAIDGDKMKLAVVSSANMSNNPRIEAGYINCNAKSMEFHKGWIMDSINGRKVY